MPSIRLGSLHTSYEVIGQGPRTLVMVQGLGLDGATWGPLAQLLAQHYKVVTFDARGAGLAQDDGAPVSTEQMAHDVLALCQALKLQSPELLGFSMGGMPRLSPPKRGRRWSCCPVCSRRRPARLNCWQCGATWWPPE